MSKKKLVPLIIICVGLLLVLAFVWLKVYIKHISDEEYEVHKTKIEVQEKQFIQEATREQRLTTLSETLKDKEVYQDGQNPDEKIVEEYESTIKAMRESFTKGYNQVIEENTIVGVEKVEDKEVLENALANLENLYKLVREEVELVTTEATCKEYENQIEQLITSYRDWKEVLNKKEEAKSKEEAEKNAEAKKAEEARKAEEAKQAEEARKAAERARQPIEYSATFGGEATDGSTIYSYNGMTTMDMGNAGVIYRFEIGEDSIVLWGKMQKKSTDGEEVITMNAMAFEFANNCKFIESYPEPIEVDKLSFNRSWIGEKTEDGVPFVYEGGISLEVVNGKVVKLNFFGA